MTSYEIVNKETSSSYLYSLQAISAGKILHITKGKKESITTTTKKK